MGSAPQVTSEAGPVPFASTAGSDSRTFEAFMAAAVAPRSCQRASAYVSKKFPWLAHQCDDIVQEGLLAIWKKGAKDTSFFLSHDHDPAGYLRRVVHHIALNRSRQLRRKPEQRLAPGFDIPDGNGDGMLGHDLLIALEEFSERERIMFLAHLMNLDAKPRQAREALAEGFGVSRTDYDGVIERMLKRVQRFLERRGYEQF